MAPTVPSKPKLTSQQTRVHRNGIAKANVRQQKRKPNLAAEQHQGHRNASFAHGTKTSRSSGTLRFPADFIDQLQAYDDLEFERVKAEQERRKIQQWCLEVALATGMVKESGRTGGIVKNEGSEGEDDGEQEVRNDLERVQGSKEEGGKNKRVRLADVAAVKIVHAFQVERNGI